MNIIKYFDRIKKMDRLIRKKATGTPEEFAAEINISIRTLFDYIKLLKSMNAPIEYDDTRKSYYYLFPCMLKVGFESKALNDDELIEIDKRIEKLCEIISLQ